jgi:hypothetical protein
MAEITTENPVESIRGKQGGSSSGYFLCGMVSNSTALVRRITSNTNPLVRNGTQQLLIMHTSNSVPLNQMLPK